MANEDLIERIGSLAPLKIADPGLANAFVTEQVPPADPTAGPQRLTMFVPHHASRLSLGEGNETYKTDRGIVGTTLENIQFETTTAAKTLVSLGLPPQHAPFERNAVPTGATGYSMVTEERAYHEAEGQHYLTSSGGDVIFHAGGTAPAVLGSHGGVVEINAGDNVSIKAGGSIGFHAKTFTPEAPAYADPYQGKQEEEAGFFSQSKLHQYADSLQQALDLALAHLSPVNEPADMAPGPGGDGSFDKAPYVTGWVKLITPYLGDTGLPWPEASVSLDANGDVSLGANVSASLFGILGSGVTGSLSAGLAGLTASVTAFAYAAVWAGVEATLRSLNHVLVASQTDKVAFQSLRGTSVVGGKRIEVAAKSTIQLNGAQTAVTADGIFMGAASSFALVGDSKELRLRKVADAATFSGGGDAYPRAGLNREHLHLDANDDTKLWLLAESVAIDSSGGKLHLSRAGITYTGEIDLEEG